MIEKGDTLYSSINMHFPIYRAFAFIRQIFVLHNIGIAHIAHCIVQIENYISFMLNMMAMYTLPSLSITFTEHIVGIHSDENGICLRFRIDTEGDLMVNAER